MDMAEKVMQDLMNDPYVSPDERTFGALINGYHALLRSKFRENYQFRAERMYFWLCKMRDLRIQPSHHLVKTFNKMDLYFPSVDEPFGPLTWYASLDPRRHGRSRRVKYSC